MQIWWYVIKWICQCVNRLCSWSILEYNMILQICFFLITVSFKTHRPHISLEVRTWDVRNVRGLHRSRTPLLHLLLGRMVCSFWCLREQAPLGREFFRNLQFHSLRVWILTFHSTSQVIVCGISGCFLMACWCLLLFLSSGPPGWFMCFLTGKTVDGEISGW